MRRARCPNCGHQFSEADADWDSARETGRCPRCQRFFEEPREESAQRLAVDPEVVARARNVRRARLMMAVGLLAIGAALFYLGFPFRPIAIALFAAAVSVAVRALLHSPKVQASRMMQGGIDLDKLSDRPAGRIE